MATGDGTREYYESLPGKRIGAGLVCRDAGNRVLLVQPTYKPGWELPGGVVEAGESPAACAAREVREELGIDLSVGRLLDRRTAGDSFEVDVPRIDVDTVIGLEQSVGRVMRWLGTQSRPTAWSNVCVGRLPPSGCRAGID